MQLFRRFVAFALAMAASFPAVALAAQPGWYVALDAGQARFNGIEADAAQWFQMPPTIQPIESGEGIAILGSALSAVSTNGDDHAAFRLTVGYQFNRYLGLELGYVDLGRVRAAGAGTLSWGYACAQGNPCPDLVGLDDYTSRASLRTRGWGAAVTGTLPLNSEWALFARLGAFDAQTRLHAVNTPAALPGNLTISPGLTDIAETEWAPTWGFGVSWTPVEHWAVRLGWDQYAHLGDSHAGGRFGVDLLSAGVVYSL